MVGVSLPPSYKVQSTYIIICHTSIVHTTQPPFLFLMVAWFFIKHRVIKQSALSDLATSLWLKVRCSSLFVVVSVLFFGWNYSPVVPLYITLMVTHWLEDHLFFSWPYFPRKSGLHNVRPSARLSVRPHIRVHACLLTQLPVALAFSFQKGHGGAIPKMSPKGQYMSKGQYLYPDGRVMGCVQLFYEAI